MRVLRRRPRCREETITVRRLFAAAYTGAARAAADPWRRRRLGLRASVLVAMLLGLPAIQASLGSPRSTTAERRPNFVVIIADDQRWDSLWAMPEVQRRLVDHGVTFTKAYVVNPACCPSRSSLLTGQYSHSTGVWRNHGTYGGFGAFDDSSTLATWLDGAGYETALFGKYLNGYQDNPYVPPGWDRWMAFTGQLGAETGNYFDYDLNVDGEIAHYRHEPEDYGTDVLADAAVRFLRTTSDPFFMVFAPPAPHLPAIPAPRHADEVGDLQRFRPVSFNEPDVTDKPGWVTAQRSMDLEQVTNLDDLRLHQYQSLLALDEAVGRIVETLRRSDRLGQTMILYVSDNGYLLGEHRLVAKAAPYEESIRVPFVMRYDALGDVGSARSEPVLNIDVAPTIAELASVRAPRVEGQSFLPLLTGSREWSRRAFLIEHLGPLGKHRVGVPTYCAVHTGTMVYVVYQHGVNELYDLRRDPHQLTNLAPSAPWRLERRFRELARSLCDPPPPEFDRLT